jgi:hypothetical protein
MLMDVITLLLVAAINRLPGAAAQAARPLGRSRRVLEVANVVTKAPLGKSVVPVITAEVMRSAHTAMSSALSAMTVTWRRQPERLEQQDLSRCIREMIITPQH